MRKTAAVLTLIMALLLPTITAIPSVIANPYPWNTLFEQEGDVSPPSLAKPPKVLLMSPQNDSLHPTSNVSFDVNVSLLGSPLVFYFGSLTYTYASPYLDSVYYEVDWLTNYTYVEPSIHFRLNLTGIPEGNHSLIVYAVEWRPYQNRYVDINDAYFYNGFKITGSSKILFTVDSTPPKVSILSIQNKTYYSPDIMLDIELFDSVSKLSYVLDGQDNVTITGNATLNGLSIGKHNLTVYATDLVGHVGVSETTYFKVVVPFPILPVVAVFALASVVAVAFLVYHKRKAKPV
jgi:hypothetical protein